MRRILEPKLGGALRRGGCSAATSQKCDVPHGYLTKNESVFFLGVSKPSVVAVAGACRAQHRGDTTYGLPNKDCGAGGFSSGGDNKNSDMYKAWIQKLVDQVGQKEVIYVLEPDAVGLASNGGCGVPNGYQGNLKTAMGLLSTNANAHIYVDIASWANQGGAVSFINDLKSAGRLAGIAINTSNYRTTSDLNSFCQTYTPDLL
ncbi:hypothetical protein Ae201684P_014397 [Aphanomyces euteiches]|nr:hypothetical protein Ae201684P_014397 [Aphanomyces euteiches]